MSRLARLLPVLTLVVACASTGPSNEPSTRGYGALDVANGTCAPVVSRAFECGSEPSMEGLCAPGTRPTAHVLQQIATGNGAQAVGYTCTDAGGTPHWLGGAASACQSLGDWYANAYSDCASRGEQMTAFQTREACSVSECSVVVTCCPD